VLTPTELVRDAFRCFGAERSNTIG